MTTQLPQSLDTLAGRTPSQTFLTLFIDRAPTSFDIADWKVGQRWIDRSNSLSATITGVTQANPAVVSSINGFTVGQLVTISGVTGMTELNGNTYEITAANGISFTINVDSSGFTPYIGGGTATVTIDHEYILNGFHSSQGVVKADWVLLSAGGGGSGGTFLDTLTGDTGGPVPADALGNINIFGTAGQITVTGSPGTNTLTLALAGGGTAVDSFTTNIAGPVVPDAAGNINVNASSSTFTDGTVANTLKTEVQGTDNTPILGRGALVPASSSTTFTITDSVATAGITGNFAVGGPQLFNQNTNTTVGATTRNVIAVAANGAGSDAYTLIRAGTLAAHSFEVGVLGSDKSYVEESAPANASVSMDGTIVRKISQAGTQSLPLQNAFSAVASVSTANVTGDGTVYTVIYDTILSQNQTGYNNATGVYTVPAGASGYYSVYGEINLQGLGAAHDTGNCRIQVNSVFYSGNAGNPFAQADATGFLNWIAGAVIFLSAGDTVSIVVQIQNSTKTVGILANFYPTIYQNHFALVKIT